MRNLTLVLPGLLGPDAHYSDDFTPELESLELLLARSTHTQNLTPSYHRGLCSLMGLDLDPERDVPVAAITRLIDDNTPPEGTWLRADPVNLTADRDGLILMDSFILRLSQHDALAVATEVNQVLAGYGWVVEVPFEDRWYMRMDGLQHLRTTELPAVTGRNIKHYLPTGPGSAQLHGIMNEIQMQLHASDLNAYRSGRGELPVNSIWFWGLGSLPEDTPQQLWQRVYSDDVFVRGLALKTATAWQPLPPGIDAVMEASADDDCILAVLPQCQAPAQYQNLPLWHQSLSLLEKAWFTPLLHLVSRGDIRRLRIVSGSHLFKTGWLSLKKIWRRPASIGHYRRA
jgi:hypothetical protein